MKLILTAVALLTALPALAQDTAARLDQAVQNYVKDKTFMGSVLVAKDDAILLNKGYGMANLEWGIPNAPNTKFRLGSITKQFTAAAILLLEERGKLSTSDPIKKHIPDAPAAWDAITIHHLLTHTAGLHNFTAMPVHRQIRREAQTVDDVVKAFRDEPLDFPVGSKMAYSNSGYLVLGLLIEKLGGGSYAAFVKDNLFAPVGMNDSGYDSNTLVIERRASGYTPTKTGIVNAEFVHMSVPHGAGALYSTTEDMLKWERALFGGKVLSAASLKKMQTPALDNYAYGLVMAPHLGRARVWHNGGINGFNTSMAYYPETKLTIIVLANLNGKVPDFLVGQLASIALGDLTGKQ